MSLRRALFFAVAALAGCAPSLPAGFVCSTSGQCVSNGISGVCEPTHACSFPDASCATGRRYGAFATSPPAGNCVDPIGGRGISRVGASTRPSGAPSGGGATLSSPAALAAGDLLLACVFADANAATIAAPSGWTPSASLVGGVLGGFHASWFWKVAVSGEPASAAFAVGGAGNVTAALVAYRGVSMTAPIDASVNQTFQAAAFTAPSITTTQPNDMLVAMFVDTTMGGAPLGAPGGMDPAVAIDHIGMFDALQAIAGPTGDKTASLGLSGVPGVGAVDFVALAPAP